MPPMQPPNNSHQECGETSCVGDGDQHERAEKDERVVSDFQHSSMQQVFLDDTSSVNISSRDEMIKQKTQSNQSSSCRNNQTRQLSKNSSVYGNDLLDISLREELLEKGEDIGVHGRNMFHFGKENDNNLDNSSTSSLSVESCGASPHKKMVNHEEEEEAVEENSISEEANLFPISCTACRRGHKKVS